MLMYPCFSRKGDACPMCPVGIPGGTAHRHPLINQAFPFPLCSLGFAHAAPLFTSFTMQHGFHIVHIVVSIRQVIGTDDQ